jgi:chromosome segregation ATPase
MTPSRYFLARFLQAFGINSRPKRMSEAATELHLLREAELILGQNIWEKLEGVEELGVEYWNLRKLWKERRELEEMIRKAEELLVTAHDERAMILNSKSDSQQKLEEKRAKLITEMEDVAKSRDLLIAKAREVRRIYDGLRAKLEVLREDGNEDEETFTKTRARMAELKAEFTGLKQQRDEIAAQLAEGDAALDAIEKEVVDQQEKVRDDAAEIFQQIGQANRDISAHKAQLGLIETQMRQLFSDIGRHVSRNIHRSEICREAVREHASLVDVMKALRNSIAMNHRLAGV